MNPYEAPRDPSPAVAPVDESAFFDLASLGRRFVGALIDGMLNLLSVVVLFFFTTPDEYLSLLRGERNSALSSQAVLGAFAFFATILAVIVLQAVLVSVRGQTVGKIVMGTKIVLVGGGNAGFVRGWLLRYGVILAGTTVVTGALGQGGNMLASVFTIIDSLWILRFGRRCLHDHIAGTEVVQIR
jgi:uncharacterized RDD family membrane protein YckC